MNLCFPFSVKMSGEILCCGIFQGGVILLYPWGAARICVSNHSLTGTGNGAWAFGGCLAMILCVCELTW